MTLKPCEFEEGEYRGPLFNQLQTSNLLWEPGQVFENHIGIDHALLTTNAYIHAIHGYTAPLAGVVLSRYDLSYIWSLRNRKKKLPPFRLNVFIQAKRPVYGRYAPRAYRTLGLKSPYWRFEITAHQQIALERLQDKLKNRAIVCYACPVFHKESMLHKWTVEPKMVENSTFPSVSALKGHIAWNFSEPGTIGIANADPTRIDAPPLEDKLRIFVAQDDSQQTSAVENLSDLANAVLFAMESDAQRPTFLDGQFAEGLRDITRIAEDLSDPTERPSIIAFGTVMLFCSMNRLSWLVAGKGG
jgi:hypothetical protein